MPERSPNAATLITDAPVQLMQEAVDDLSPRRRRGGR